MKLEERKQLRHRCRLVLEFSSEHFADIVYRCIELDVKERLSDRSFANIEKLGREVIVDIYAQDLSALRALINSYLRSLIAILRTYTTLIHR